jgi:hypothetical protein
MGDILNLRNLKAYFDSPPFSVASILYDRLPVPAVRNYLKRLSGRGRLAARLTRQGRSLVQIRGHLVLVFCRRRPSAVLV